MPYQFIFASNPQDDLICHGIVLEIEESDAPFTSSYHDKKLLKVPADVIDFNWRPVEFLDIPDDRIHRRYQLLDLPWEDILLTHVLCYLPLRHLVSLQRVSKSFRSLIQLYLSNCRSFDPAQTGPHVPKEAFCSMLCNNNVLQCLSVRNCCDWITDQELLPVIGQNQQLQRVDLYGCVHLTRHALVALALGCPQLQHLGLAHCDWVDNLALHSLADHCTKLQTLDLTACRQLREEALCYGAAHWSSLRSLSVAINANITDTTVEEVAKHCRELEHLDLTGCLRVNHCHNICESSLSVLRRRNVQIDVKPPHQRALVLLQNMVDFAPFINPQI
ncbi:F-box/LRR-repeat protein 15 [Bagarius yarrelli]|uniref:F-box/LRR-repeat protein 15 n=1 Tax=Bagarius yarrelli TaxID=175774 RepID=A0A556TWT5_BAGYA|nr:F-box/LRR-repeat protein 15 [Bagarius yarrelli]